MKIICNTILLLLLIPAVCFSNNGKKKGKYQKEKSYHQEFTVNPDALLEINNHFGDISITTWNENKTVISANISVSGNNEKKVIEKIKQISIRFTNTKKLVQAITEIETKNWSTNNLTIDITYVIKAPVGNKMLLENKYGNINLNHLNNKATISCKYGSIDIGKLNHSDNEINLKYSENSSIQYIKNGVISSKYSTITIDKTDALVINADYTNTYIGSADIIEFEGKYGDLNINQIRNLVIDGNYLKIKLNELLNTLNIDTSYSTINVNQIKKHFQKINIVSQYSTIALKYNPDTSFKFNILTNYGNFKYNDNLIISSLRESKKSKAYSGHTNNNTSLNHIGIESDYTNVILNNID